MLPLCLKQTTNQWHAKSQKIKDLNYLVAHATQWFVTEHALFHQFEGIFFKVIQFFFILTVRPKKKC
jgi:hypothetical protein